MRPGQATAVAIQGCAGRNRVLKYCGTGHRQKGGGYLGDQSMLTVSRSSTFEDGIMLAKLNPPDIRIYDTCGELHSDD